MRIAAFANFVSSFARGLYMRRAFVATIVTIITLAFIAGCGSTGGSVTPPVQKTTPTITWATPAAITYGTALSSTQQNATASVAGTFVYNPLAGTVLAAGKQTLSVTFTPSDPTDYNDASGSVQLTVNQAMPTVNCPTPAPITAGTALSGTQLDCTASVPGTFVYTLAGNVPALGAVPPVGTDTITVTFTPTDSTDYASVTTSMSIVVNPAAPQINAFTIGGGQYAVEDNFSNTFLPWVVTGTGFASGDNFSLAYPSTSSTVSNFYVTSFTSTMIDGGINFNALDYEPSFITVTDTNAAGKSSNSYSAPFLGSGSQSTLAISATTGTALQVQQKSGEIDSLTTNGTTGVFTPSTYALQTPTVIAIDDVSDDVVDAYAAGGFGEAVAVDNKNSTSLLCGFYTPGITLISSIAVKNGQIVFTAPNENLVGFASLSGCSGAKIIAYSTVSVAGQPWAVAMSGSDAYVLSRDNAGNNVPRITKLSVPSGTVEGFVDLTGMPTVTSIRATTPYEGIYQVTAFNQTQVANVLFMSDKTDGKVLTISTNTSNGAKMAVTYTTAIADLPVSIAPQESGSVTKPVLWIGYVPADAGGNVVDVGALDPATGNYTPGVGACQSGLVGGFAASANGLQCAQGGTIGAPLVLPYSTF
jgi:predicted small lipoprotein YifL